MMSSVVVGMGEEEEQAQRPGPSILAYPHQEAVTMLTPSQNNFTRDLYTVSQLVIYASNIFLRCEQIYDGREKKKKCI